MKILDCTLRDGGYYTNWDFSNEITETYFQSLNNLPVDYIEIGYRSMPQKDYYGKYFYSPLNELKKIKSISRNKIAIILNEKDVLPEHLEELLLPCKGYVDMVRIALAPKNIKSAIKLAEGIKKMDYEVAFNVMYMSKWKSDKDFIEEIKNVNGLVDYFYMVDSYGGVYPNDVIEIINLVRSKTNVPLGFHGHNNLELALVNTLTALDNGVEIIDSTITGMGRGAGNLKTELLLTSLHSQNKIELDFNSLTTVVQVFDTLQKEYEWGTNLPYMVSGAYSLPQKDVMEWVSKRYYSFNSIIRALDNQAKGIRDNVELKKLDFSILPEGKRVLIVGGGPSIHFHASAISEFLSKNEDVIIIHASSKNAKYFEKLTNRQFFCLMGNEGIRLEEIFDGKDKFKGICILPPFPRKMGTYIPLFLNDNVYELEKIDISDELVESQTSMSLQLAKDLGAGTIYFLGFDGYSGSNIRAKDQELFLENDYLFKSTKDLQIDLVSLTDTKYKHLKKHSIYEFISF